MKRTLCFFLAMIMLVSLCGCSGNYQQTNLQDSIKIPEDGKIEQSLIAQIQEENAIGSFCGESNGFSYEWTIFGSDISTARDINLLLTITEQEDGIAVSFAETEPFGFPALLSIHLNELWNAQSATVYQDKTAVCSASLTGSNATILNISIDSSLGDCIILPDEIPDLETTSDASDGSATTKDQYNTDPVPAGKPMPVEPEDQEIITAQTHTCTFSIECSTILNNLENLDPDKLDYIPSNGVILKTTTVTFYEGESVYDVLQRVCKENNIPMESSWTPIYNSAYIEGICNLYEYDCGNLSGWMYRVNGWYPNYGSSRYQLAQDDVVEWRYTCDLGNDIGRDGTW